MADDSLGGADEEFREMIAKFLAGEGDIDPAKFAGAAGLPTDPLMVARLMGQLQRAMNSTADGIDWQLARDEAGRIAARLQSKVLQYQIGRSRGNAETDHPRYPHRIRGGQLGESRRLRLEQVEAGGCLGLDEEGAGAVAEPEGLADVAARGGLAAAILEGCTGGAADGGGRPRARP
jgi:hypothetical protein